MQKKISLYIALGIACIDWIGVGLVYPMFSALLFHKESLILDPSTSDAMRGFWLGALLSAMPLAQFLSSPVLGSLSDAKGRKPVLVFTLALSCAGYLVSALGVQLESLLLLLLGRLSVGVAAGNAAVAGAVMADISLPEEKGKNFGLLNMASGMGFTVGPFLGGKLSEFGFAKPFLFSGILTSLNLLLLLLLFKETYPVRKKVKLALSFGFRNFQRALQKIETRTLLLSTFIFCFGWSFYWEFIPVAWIEDYGLNASQVGNFYAYAAAIYALSCGLLIRPVLKRFAAAKILFFSLALLGIYILCYPIHKDPSWLWAFFPLQQYLTAFLFPTAATLVSDWAAKDIQGEAMGIYQSTESFAFGVSPLLSGVFVGLSHKMPIYVGGISMLLAALVLRIGCSKAIFSKEPR